MKKELPLQKINRNLEIINNLKQTIMKKFFTLIAAVAMAASVNAQTTVVKNGKKYLNK